MEGRKRIAVVGSDARQAAAGRALARAGYAVAGAEQVARADVILLPLPLDESRTPLAQLLRAAKPGAFALGGRLSAQAVENLRKARQTLGERAKILAGIMPVVSQRNAIFMENEINGIHVEDWIIEKFAGLDRAQGEELGLAISLEMAKAALPYADGLYLMTPFNRVALMERLIGRLKQEVLGAY